MPGRGGQVPAPGDILLLPATFIVIVGTVAVYGLGAVPVARALGLAETDGDTTTVT
jgi:NhaP-type Na+/H+ or K+/H+ antiporter